MGFAGLLGNEDLKKRLSASIGAGKNSHCYLICGPEGSGKRTLASLIAQALQCEGSGAPCGVCNACRKVQKGIHPDVITVDDPEKKSVQVELSRQVQADAYVRPNEGKKKIYLIPRAQLMTNEAQNALLKLIEEPPHYAVFLFLTTNAEKLLPTVRSRSAELRMKPVSWQEAAPWLQSQRPADSVQTLQAAHRRCGGFLGQALTMLNAEAELPRTGAFVRAFAENDRYGLTALLCGMEKLPREQLTACFSQWKMLLTAALSVRAGIPDTPEAELLGRQRTARELAAAAELMQQALEYCSANIGAGHICGYLAASLS